jgi:hypothetical protein
METPKDKTLGDLMSEDDILLNKIKDILNAEEQ